MYDMEYPEILKDWKFQQKGFGVFNIFSTNLMKYLHDLKRLDNIFE